MTPNEGHDAKRGGEHDMGGGRSQLVTLVVGSTERRAAKVLAQWSARWTKTGPEDIALGAVGEPGLVLTLSPEDAALVGAGKLAPSVAYMQGRLKAAGDNGLLLRVLRWSATPAFPQALARWKAAPELKPEVSLTPSGNP